MRLIPLESGKCQEHMHANIKILVTARLKMMSNGLVRIYNGETFADVDLDLKPKSLLGAMKAAFLF